MHSIIDLGMKGGFRTLNVCFSNINGGKRSILVKVPCLYDLSFGLGSVNLAPLLHRLTSMQVFPDRLKTMTKLKLFPPFI